MFEEVGISGVENDGGEMSSTFGGRNVDLLVAIKVHGGSNVPAMDAMVRPSYFLWAFAW